MLILFFFVFFCLRRGFLKKGGVFVSFEWHEACSVVVQRP